MNCDAHINCGWRTCTLCRSSRQSVLTYERAKRRSVEWPSQLHGPPNDHERATFCSIDDAFDSVFHSMSSTSHQCKRFHRSLLKHHTSDSDLLHIRKYHQTTPTARKTYKNPLEKPEEINVDVGEGTYTVSAGAWGSDRQHTHVVHINNGQTVDLTFGI